jgi:lipoprotein Spr
LDSFIANWLGKPYRYGGESTKGIDCSALVQRLYKDVYHTSIPRTSEYQLDYFDHINIKDLQIGDVIFFKSSYSPSGRHVGVYIGNDQFFHAANYKQGVIVSCLDGRYSNIIAVGRLK